MSSLRILVVDDHEVVRRGLCSLLATRADWQVCGEAGDGLEALEMAKALRPNMVLMDISMPRMNGLDAARILHSELPECQVIIVSMNDPAIARGDAEDVGAAAYVTKNQTPQVLLSTIDGVIAQQEPVNGTNGNCGHGKSAGGWLAGGGELGKLIREHDWSRTSLGPIDNWPQSLRTSANLMLNSQHPMWIGWGPEMLFLYNDAYISVLSLAKHPKALGRPAREVWSEIWDICGPLADKVFKNGEATFVNDVRLFMRRGDFLEETFYSFSYSPIHDEAGNVGGLFCPSSETTPKVLNARRLQTLSELSAKALAEKSTEAACASAMATLAKNPIDIPFGLLYLFEAGGKHARLQQSTGVSGDIERASPQEVALENEPRERSFWPMMEVSRTSQSQIVSLSGLKSVPLGPAEQRVVEAMVLPVSSRGEDRPIGVLVAGVNPTRKLDAEYRTFYELIAGQVARAVQNARAAEEERKRIEAMAEIDRAKTAFFSNVSHEFRTPLTLMLGPVEDLLAKSHTDLSPAAKSQLELVNRNGSRLLRLVNTLLDFSRIEAGRMQAVYEPTDLCAFTLELASVFRSATEKAGLRLELDCRKLPAPVFVDRNMWEKIVLNLISNAFKFTFEGEIRVSLTQVEGAAELRVRDTGVGIPEQELAKLFDRFHRIESARSRTHEGSGIGLALVQELVKLHGGSVRVESTLGQGSTFIVSVPLGNAHLPAERIGARDLVSTAVGAAPFVEEALRWLPDTEGQEAIEEIPRDNELIPVPCPPLGDDEAPGRPLVLVADDNADMRHYLVRLLSERYEVQAVPDGQAALQAVRERVPVLVLSDVMMPHLNGFGLLRELRSDPKTRTIPVIFLSARAGEESRVEGMEQGADDYLIKPFSARELLARVQAHLQMARARKQAEESLRESEARFREMIDALPVAIYTTDAEGRITHFNPAAVEFSGRRPELGSDQWCVTWKLFRPDGTRLPHDECPMAVALKEGRIVDGVEAIAERPDGTRLWFTPYPRPLRNAEGRIIGGINMLLDITERKAAERTSGLLAAIVDSSNDAVISKTLDGVITSWNNSAERLFGYRAEEAVGRHITLIIPSDRRSEEVSILNRLRRGERLDHFETVRVCKDGTLRDISLTISPVKDAAGRIVGASKVARDVTERKQAERALQDSENRLRTLTDTLETLVQARTEELELRNSEVLKQSEQLRELSHRLMQIQDNERRHIARELHDSAGQILAALGMNLASVVQQAKESAPQLAREAGDAQELVRELSQEIRTTSYLLHPPLLDESGLSEALLWYIQGLKERSGLDIHLDIPEDFGRLSNEMELVIFRVVQEALTNVHRHSGSKVAAIRVSRDAQNVSLEVQDEGQGIAPEKLAEIQTRGAGVGLRGMRERVRQLGGQMRIESDGRGTRISVALPLAEAAHSKIAEHSQQAQMAR